MVGQELDELKERSVVSCKLWREEERRKSDPLFNKYRSDKSAYRRGIRSREYGNKNRYNTVTTFMKRCYVSKVLISGNVGNLNLNVPPSPCQLH